MKKKLLCAFLICFIIIAMPYVTVKAISISALASSIEYPVPSKQKDGKIIYLVEYDCDRSRLQLKQNKSWPMSTIPISTGKLEVQITVPYTEIRENSTFTTTIDHKLESYELGHYADRNEYLGVFEVPVMRYTGPNNKAISLKVGESKTFNPITLKNYLKSNPDDEKSFDYIWKNLMVQTSNTSVVEVGNITSNVLDKSINITLKGKSSGTAEISLISPTNQKEVVAKVTVEGTGTNTGGSTGDSTGGPTGGSTGGTTDTSITLVGKEIAPPIRSKYKKGYIEYTISHPSCTLNDLTITQKPNYNMTQTVVNSTTSKIKVDIPYSAVDTNASTPTVLNHTLNVSSAATGKIAFLTEFTIPVITSVKKETNPIMLYLDELTSSTGSRIYGKYIGKLEAVMPDEKAYYEFILNNLIVKTSNENILKVYEVLPNYSDNTFQVNLDALGTGTCGLILVSPTKQEFVLGDVIIKDNKTYEIYEEKYFCNVSTKSKRENIQKLMNSGKEFFLKNKQGENVGDQDTICTGMQILFDNFTYSIVVTGDTSGDGNFSSTDLSQTKLHIVEQQLLNDEYKLAADMNEDKKITVTDLSIMKNTIVGNS